MGAFMARPLPDEVVDAIVVHPERRLRSTFAESFAVSGEQRGRLVDDPHFRVRQVLANAPNPFRSGAPSLPLPVQRRLLDDPEPIVRRDAAFYGNFDDRLIAGLCDHEDAFMRGPPVAPGPCCPRVTVSVCCTTRTTTSGSGPGSRPAVPTPSGPACFSRAGWTPVPGGTSSGTEP